MSLTSDSEPSGGDRIVVEGKGQREPRLADSLPDDVESEVPEEGVPGPACEGTATRRARVVVASLPERYAELRASGLVCGRW